MKALLLAAAAGLILTPAARAETKSGPSMPEPPAAASTVPEQPQNPNGGQSDGTVPHPDEPAAQPSEAGTGEAAKGSGPDGMAGPHNPVPPASGPPGAP